MNRERLRSDILKQKEFCLGRSPLYAGVLAEWEKELAAGEPPWLRRLAEAFKDREHLPEYEAPLLLLAMLHYDALRGRGEVEAQALAAKPDAFWRELSSARLQTNEVNRSLGWLLVACVALRARGTPFHLVDMGCSAGLNLIGDYLPRECRLTLEDGQPAAEPEQWRESPYPVLARLGLDARPRDVSNPEDRLWLKACIWADDEERLARFDRAAELFARLSREASGPRLERRTFSEMPTFLLERLKPHPEEGLLLFNSQAVDFLSDAEYAAFGEGLRGVLEPWGDRAFWVELELPRDRSSPFHELKAHRLVSGKLETRVLATLAAHPKEVRLRRGWDFLRPLEPVSPPRITREERPRWNFPATNS